MAKKKSPSAPEESMLGQKVSLVASKKGSVSIHCEDGVAAILMNNNLISSLKKINGDNCAVLYYDFASLQTILNVILIGITSLGESVTAEEAAGRVEEMLAMFNGEMSNNAFQSKVAH